MKFNLRFITTLILIVLIIISFVFIVLETLYFSNTKKLVIEENANTNAKVIDTSTAAAGAVVKIKTPGTAADKLVSDTQYYRYGSLLIHVLAMISGAYIVYSG